MIDRSRHRPVRSRTFRLGAAICACWYLLVISGVPISLPLVDGSSKDRSVPFPCMDCPCGCSNAEQCWSDCCCHSVEERLAWARNHGIKPPSYLIAAKVEGRPATRACCAAKRQCCSAHTAPCCQTTKHVHQEQETGNKVALIEALKCKGFGLSWLTIPATAPPDFVTCSFDHVCCGRIELIESLPHILKDAPPIPPPRLSPA